MADGKKNGGGDSSSGTAIVKFDPTKFTIIQRADRMRDVLAANMGEGGRMRSSDLTRVTIPSGGGLAFSVADAGGEPLSATEITGVVLGMADKRVFWQTSFEDAPNSPPDCSSEDGVTGIGFIRGEEKEVVVNGQKVPATPKTRKCATCPMSQWGSGDVNLKPGKTPTNSQACAARKLLFLVRPGDALPIVIDLPPTSIGAMRDYLKALTCKGIPIYGALTTLKLRPETSNGGIKYSLVVPSLAEPLSDQDADAIKVVADKLMPYLRTVSVTVEGEEPQAA